MWCLASLSASNQKYSVHNVISVISRAVIFLSLLCGCTPSIPSDTAITTSYDTSFSPSSDASNLPSDSFEDLDEHTRLRTPLLQKEWMWKLQ